MCYVMYNIVTPYGDVWLIIQFNNKLVCLTWHSKLDTNSFLFCSLYLQVVLVFILSIASLIIYFIDASNEEVERCQKWNHNITQQIDLAFNIFFMVYYFIRVSILSHLCPSLNDKFVGKMIQGQIFNKISFYWYIAVSYHVKRSFQAFIHTQNFKLNCHWTNLCYSIMLFKKDMSFLICYKY